MSEIVMRGHPDNIAGLLRLMAEEVEATGTSRTCFAEHPDDDPSVTLSLTADESRVGPGSTTVQVHRA